MAGALISLFALATVPRNPRLSDEASA